MGLSESNRCVSWGAPACEYGILKDTHYPGMAMVLKRKGDDITGSLLHRAVTSSLYYCQRPRGLGCTTLAWPHHTPTWPPATADRTHITASLLPSFHRRRSLGLAHTVPTVLEHFSSPSNILLKHSLLGKLFFPMVEVISLLYIPITLCICLYYKTHNRL